MQLLRPTGNGGARCLPFWFASEWALGIPRDWADVHAIRPTLAFGSWCQAVQSVHMQFGTQNGLSMSYFSEAPEAGGESPQSGPVLVMPPLNKPTRPHRWPQRLWLVVFVLFCLEVGIILTVLPWTRLWTDNYLLTGFPAVREFLNQNFVRGLVSGLGLIDIWMGVTEAVTYRERS